MENREVLPPPGEVLNDTEYIAARFDSLAIEAQLSGYLGDRSREDDLAALLSKYATILAETALDDSQIDVSLIRFGVEHLTQTMNRVCNEHYGFKKPRGPLETLQFGADPEEPEPMSYVRMLDDKYWNEQFTDQYLNQGLTRWRREESEEEYFARYVGVAIHGFVYAPFTLI